MKSDKPAAWHRRAHLRQMVILAALATLFGPGLPKLWADATVSAVNKHWTKSSESSSVPLLNENGLYEDPYGHEDPD